MKGVLCFGDSITFGRGEVPSVGWCGRLKKYFESKDEHNGVYNLGIPGHTSTELLDRLVVESRARIRIKRPGDRYLILIAIGTNDCKFDGSQQSTPRTSEDRFRNNIERLVGLTKSLEAGVAFIGLPPVDEARTFPYEDTWFKLDRVKLFNDIIKESCEASGVLFFDMFGAMVDEDFSALLADGLHPNSEGYDFMFEKIKSFIEKNKLI